MSDDKKPMFGLHAPQEQQIAEGPHVWVQWKGTEVCCDFNCACGAHGHVDGMFMYFLECPVCHQLYEVGTHMTLYPITKAQHWGGDPLIPEVRS